MLKSAFGRLSTGVCRQPQWVNVGVFMYSLTGWCILFPADYAPAWADSRSGFMSGCLCTHCPGGSFVLPADYAPAWADNRSGFMSGCLCIHWPGGAGSTAYSFQRIMLRRVQTAAVGLCRGVYVFIGRVAALAFQRFMLRRRQTAAVGLWRGVYVLIARVGALSFLRIMLRRMQTAAVGLCRGVYVLIVRVKPVLRTELYLIIHAEMPLRLFMDFSAGSLCIFKRNITASQEKLYLILRAALTPT